MDKQVQRAPLANSIETQTPNIKKSMNILSGNCAGSFNGGHATPIFFKQVMAGEKHYGFKWKTNIQMLTPLTPAYQKLHIVFDTYWVPNRRVWNKAIEFEAQGGGASTEKVEEIPNLKGKEIPFVVHELGSQNKKTNLTNTTLWRDAWISKYLPRMGWFGTVYNEDTEQVILKNISALPLRGFRAIYNDFLRNREYDAEIQEYHGNEVSEVEWESYLPTSNDRKWARAKRMNSYWTDYRTELQGFETPYPPEDMSADVALMKWASYESKIAEARKEALNAQKRPIDILAEISGSKKLTEGVVCHIGRRVESLNYSAITQNAYNNNEEIREDFRLLGKQGAYSYTEIEIPLYGAYEFNEPGYIHVIATVYADTVFEKALNRLEMNTKALERYRADMSTDKLDVLYNYEYGDKVYWRNENEMSAENNPIVGYKRKYNEYFKLNNIVMGDMTSSNYFEMLENTDVFTDTQIETQKTYQFYEESGWFFSTPWGEVNKAYWKDYTDLLINKNQAIMNEVYQSNSEEVANMNDTYLKGNHQIFFVAEATLICELPIEEGINNNYLTWGEH